MYSKEFLITLYRIIYTIRVFETECIRLYRQGLIRGYFHPYLGEEAIAAGVCAALDKEDYIVSTHRGHGHCIARGASINKMVSELLGKKTGYCHGLGGSMHIADVTTNNLGANGIVGGGIPIGVGAALGISIRKENRVVVIFFSDGASNNGVFSESLNLAAIWSLPAIFLLENNHYAVSTPIEQSSRNPDLYKRTIGYGIKGYSIDGNDVLKVYEKTKEAVNVCRKGKGPILIETKTYRHGGHHVNDPGLYMPKERLELYKSKDPLKVCRQHLIRIGKVSKNDIETIEKEINKNMAEAVEYAEQSPEPTVKEFLQFIKDY